MRERELQTGVESTSEKNQVTQHNGQTGGQTVNNRHGFSKALKDANIQSLRRGRRDPQACRRTAHSHLGKRTPRAISSPPVREGQGSQ